MISAPSSPRQRRLQSSAHETGVCVGTLHEGDCVKVFSQGGNAWVNAEVKEIIDPNYIRVEYASEEYWCSKKLHLDSEHLHLSTSHSQSLKLPQCADEKPSEECHSADPHDEKSNEMQQKHEEPTFRYGDEVHYYRDGPNIWVYATIKKVLKESAEVAYELEYEAWDEAPARMKKNEVSEKKLLAMQETCYQQPSRGSLKRSVRTDGKPMWCRNSAKDHIRKVQKGDEVWFKRSNRNAVVAEIKELHEWEGEDAKVDLTYVGLDEHDVPRRWHKEGVTKGELAILQHPRNWQPSPKRTWCEDKQQAAHQTPSRPQWICEDCDEPNNLMRTECNNCGRARSDPQQCFQTAAALASKRKITQLHAASRDGDAELVRRLLLQRVDPTAQNQKDGSSALHAAAYHGHPIVLDMLVNQVEHTCELSEHKNKFGETPLDVARERLRFCPRDDAVQVFVRLFGRNPRAQEKASRVMESINISRDIRTYNQGFIEAVVLCPLIGDRTAPYSISTCDVHEIAMGIEKEERRVLDDECKEYNDWSYWRASFARGIRRHGIQDAFTRRMDAAKMRQLLHDARNDSSNAEFALPQCAIKLYTAATFLFKATNFAMRSKEHAFKFEHLGPYARLLNYSVRYYADKKPWTGRVHRVLPIYDDVTVQKYSQKATAVYDNERFFSWSGFISATAWDQECMIFQDLRKYGAGKECIVFIISPDPQGGSVYPVDLGDLACFGAQDRELLYPAGQQFKVIKYEGCHTREQFAKDFDLKFDIVKDKGENLHIVWLQAVEAFTEFSHDFFKEGGNIKGGENIKAAERFLQNRLQEVRRQGHTWNVSLYEDMLARCWHQMGKYEEAEAMFRQTLKVREQELGLTHRETLHSCSHLAAVLQDMGKYGEAEPMFRLSLKVREQKLGLTHRETQNICNSLAGLLQKMGKYEEAETMYRQTLKVQEQELGLTHPDTLISCTNLAALLQEMGKYEEAEPMCRQTLKVQEQKLGLTHPNTLTSYNNLAALLQKMGKYEEAETMYRQTLTVFEQQLGLTHPTTLTICNNLATLLHKMGKYEEAEPMFRQTLKVFEQKLGLTHPHTLSSCTNLALLLQEMGKYEEAEPMLRQTLKVREQKLGLTHPNTLNSCKDLAELLRDMGKYEEAERMLRQTLQAAEAKLGPAHALTRA